MTGAENKAVFLSYASQDAEAARRICEALRAAGVEVWFDQNELVGGDAWDAKIRKQIAECALFVPVISAATQARLEGYFRIEWKLAAQRTHAMAEEKAFLLPVVIDVTRDAEAKVPAEFRAVQWTRLPEGETPPAFGARVKKLLEANPALDEGHSRTPERGGSVKSERDSRQLGRRVPRAAWIGGSVAVIAAFVAAGFLWRNRPNVGAERPAPTTDKATMTASESGTLLAKVWALLEKPELGRPDLEAAEELCKRAAALDATDADVLAAWSQVETWRIYHGLDDTSARRESARTKAIKALQLAPASYEARLAQACFLVRGRGGFGAPDNVAEVEASLRTLLRERPAEPRALLALGILQRNTKQATEAVATFEQLARHPKFAALAWNEAGWVHLFAGNFRSAEVAAEKSLAVNAYWANLLLRVRLALRWHGDLDLAKATLDRFSHLFKQDDTGVETALFVHRNRRDPAEMLRLLTNTPRDWLTGRQPGPKALYAALAHEMAARGEAARIEWQAALRLVEQRLIDQPSSPNLLRMHGRILAKLGRRAEAEKQLLLARQLTSEPDTAEDPIDHVLLEQYDEALASLEKDADIGPATLLTAAYLRIEPMLDPLRGLPRFRSLQARLDADPRFSPTAKSPNPSAAATQPAEKSVAVLAFENKSDDPANALFSDGLSEDLIGALGRVPGLTVTGWTSSLFLKNKHLPTAEIGKQLGVSYVVRGSVYRMGSNTVRITAQVSRAATDVLVWASAPLYIAQAPSLRLGVAMMATADVNPAAYQLYLEGRQAWRLRNVAGYARAENLFERALALEPKLVSAQVGLFDVALNRGEDDHIFGRFGERANPSLVKIATAVERLLESNQASTEARATLGKVRWMEWKFEEGIREERRALALNPNLGFAQMFLGRLLLSDGKLEEALAALQRAHELDPLVSRIADNYSIGLLAAQRHSEALTLAERALELQPDSAQALALKTLASAELGRTEAVKAGVARFLADYPERKNDSIAYALARIGARAEAEKLLSKIPEDERLLDSAAAYLVLGKKEEALRIVESGMILCNNLQAMLYWPAFDPIRSEPRFIKRLAALGLTESHARARAGWKLPPEETAAPPNK